MNDISNFFGTLLSRVTHKNTTIGGGVAGVILAAIIGKIEEMSGCNFAVAFGNIDWMQLSGFITMQIFGAVMTDANKTVGTQPTDKGNT